VRGRHPADLVLTEAEMAAAIWVSRHDEEAGPGTETLPGGDWTFVPQATARGVVGVIGVRTPKERGTLSLDQRELLHALARQAAVAIERSRIDVVLEEKAKTEQIMEASEDGLIVLDPSGVVIHANEVACAILEMDRSAIVDRGFDQLEVKHTHYLRLREAVREYLRVRGSRLRTSLTRDVGTRTRPKFPGRSESIPQRISGVYRRDDQHRIQLRFAPWVLGGSRRLSLRSLGSPVSTRMLSWDRTHMTIRAQLMDMDGNLRQRVLLVEDGWLIEGPMPDEQTPGTVVLWMRVAGGPQTPF